MLTPFSRIVPAAALAAFLFVSCLENQSTAGIEVGNPNEKTAVSLFFKVDTETSLPGHLSKKGALEEIEILQMNLNFHQVELHLDSNPDEPDIKLNNVDFPGLPFDFLDTAGLDSLLHVELDTASDWYELQVEFYYPVDNDIPLSQIDFGGFNTRGVIKGTLGAHRIMIAMPQMTQDPNNPLWGSPELRFVYPKKEIQKYYTKGRLQLELTFYARYWLDGLDLGLAEPDLDINGDSLYIFSSGRNAGQHGDMMERFINAFSLPFDTIGY